jgi:four helix bundle protein
MALRTYRELDAWQQGIALVERCYKQTRSFPSDERLGLTAQLRRAAVSIPSNVAEGACRLTTKAFVNHVGIALGSLAEVETCVEIAARLVYLPPEEAKALFEVAGNRRPPIERSRTVTQSPGATTVDIAGYLHRPPTTDVVSWADESALVVAMVLRSDAGRRHACATNPCR